MGGRFPKSELRTKYANEASALAEAFEAKLGEMRVGGYRPELTAPDVQSTAGGVQATQHVRLVPEQGSSNAAVVIGSANAKDAIAELRTYEYAEHLHRQRFKADLPFERAEYETFLARAQAFFEGQKLGTTRVGIPSVPPPALPSRSRTIAIVVLLILSAAIAVYVLAIRK